MLIMHNTLQLVLILLAAAVLVVALFRSLRLPPLLAYLLVGIVIGPHALGWVPESGETSYLAEFGVVFLMFSIGLEFSLPQLKAMQGLVFGLGGAQVAIDSGAGTGGVPGSGVELASRCGAGRHPGDVVHGHCQQDAG